jgi:hypothetical protein
MTPTIPNATKAGCYTVSLMKFINFPLVTVLPLSVIDSCSHHYSAGNPDGLVKMQFACLLRRIHNIL